MPCLYGVLGCLGVGLAIWAATRYRLRRRYLYLALLPGVACLFLSAQELFDWRLSGFGLVATFAAAFLYGVLLAEGSARR